LESIKQLLEIGKIVGVNVEDYKDVIKKVLDTTLNEQNLLNALSNNKKRKIYEISDEEIDENSESEEDSKTEETNLSPNTINNIFN
jgi:hypothetical protein